MFVLTVEDEFLISEYLRAILEGGGHKVIATFDAGEAIEVLERVRDIQLVITDIDMPGSMDGLRLAAAIRDRCRRRSNDHLSRILARGGECDRKIRKNSSSPALPHRAYLYAMSLIFDGCHCRASFPRLLVV